MRGGKFSSKREKIRQTRVKAEAQRRKEEAEERRKAKRARKEESLKRLKSQAEKKSASRLESTRNFRKGLPSQGTLWRKHMQNNEAEGEVHGRQTSDPAAVASQRPKVENDKSGALQAKPADLEFRKLIGMSPGASPLPVAEATKNLNSKAGTIGKNNSFQVNMDVQMQSKSGFPPSSSLDDDDDDDGGGGKGSKFLEVLKSVVVEGQDLVDAATTARKKKVRRGLKSTAAARERRVKRRTDLAGSDDEEEKEEVGEGANGDGDEGKRQLKLCQIKVQDFLHQQLDQMMEFVPPPSKPTTTSTMDGSSSSNNREVQAAERVMEDREKPASANGCSADDGSHEDGSYGGGQWKGMDDAAGGIRFFRKSPLVNAAATKGAKQSGAKKQRTGEKHKEDRKMLIRTTKNRTRNSKENNDVYSE
eukprot:TRINITY_DN2608_c0_g1_i1.p1 TRINITY_DN2608_c0_g1~~TRINITY_DN2608_c0_g1_i1.p1  ORF type:complete len:419 (+),score=115.72 TRINITY_DN2608_c0_g1_i1:190-1446(+)